MIVLSVSSVVLTNILGLLVHGGRPHARTSNRPVHRADVAEVGERYPRDLGGVVAGHRRRRAVERGHREVESEQCVL